MPTLEQRLDDIEQRQADLDSDLAFAREKIEQLKLRARMSFDEFELWDIMEKLFASPLVSDMRKCRACSCPVLHMEHLTLDEAHTLEKRARALLEQDMNTWGEGTEEYQDELTGVRMTIERADMQEEHPKITVICPEQRILSLEQINAALARLRQRAKIDPDAFSDVLASELK